MKKFRRGNFRPKIARITFGRRELGTKPNVYRHNMTRETGARNTIWAYRLSLSGYNSRSKTTRLGTRVLKLRDRHLIIVRARLDLFRNKRTTLYVTLNPRFTKLYLNLCGPMDFGSGVRRRSLIPIKFERSEISHLDDAPQFIPNPT